MNFTLLLHLADILAAVNCHVHRWVVTDALVTLTLRIATTLAVLEAVLLCLIAVWSEEWMRTQWAHTSHLCVVWHQSMSTVVNTAIVTLHLERLDDVATLHVLVMHSLGVAPVYWPWMTLCAVSSTNRAVSSGVAVSTLEAHSFRAKL